MLRTMVIEIGGARRTVDGKRSTGNNAPSLGSSKMST